MESHTFAIQIRAAGYCLAILIVLTAGSGCGDDHQAASTDVAFETIQEGFDGHFNRPWDRDRDPLTAPTVFRFDDPESFGAFWRQLLVVKPEFGPPTPVVDFDTHTVVAVVDAPELYYANTVTIQRIERRPGQLRVLVVYRVIGDFCYKGDLLTQPYHIVALAKTNLDIEMQVDTDLVTCTPIP